MKGGEGIGRSWLGVVGGVADRVDASEGEEKTCLGVDTGGDLAGDGGVEALPSRFESFSNAFLSLPFRPPLFTMFSLGSGEGAIGT